MIIIEVEWQLMCFVVKIESSTRHLLLPIHPILCFWWDLLLHLLDGICPVMDHNIDFSHRLYIKWSPAIKRVHQVQGKRRCADQGNSRPQHIEWYDDRVWSVCINEITIWFLGNRQNYHSVLILLLLLPSFVRRRIIITASAQIDIRFVTDLIPGLYSAAAPTNYHYLLFWTASQNRERNVMMASHPSRRLVISCN